MRRNMDIFPVCDANPCFLGKREHDSCLIEVVSKVRPLKIEEAKCNHSQLNLQAAFYSKLYGKVQKVNKL